MECSRILVIDDEHSIRELLKLILRNETYQISVAANAKESLELCQKQQPEIIIQDMMLPDMDGIELLKQIKQMLPSAIIIVITAALGWQIAVEAMRLGAFDYIRKPFDNDHIKAVISRAIKYKALRGSMTENIHPSSLQNIIGSTPSVQKIQDIIRRAAPTDSTILIHGESGTGKELVARGIHLNSLRREFVFIPVNCGALSETLMESELFGHTKGAFTGAITDKKGLFEVANHGTLFFDEIGEMSLSTQVKLLRVLEYCEFIPVGATSGKEVDVRFITATNRNLEKQIDKGEFREDLYYRLNVIPIYLPPLRERKEDIPLLAGHFLAIYSNRMRKYVTQFADDAMLLLLAYHWPGNIRELSNLIQRAVVMCESNIILKKDLEHHISIDKNKKDDVDETLLEQGIDIEKHLEEIEKKYIKRALQKTNGNLTNAAAILKMTLRSIRYKVKKYNLNTF